MNIDPKIIPPHGGYKKLACFQMAEIVYDATIRFCERFIDKRSRTTDQMIQAARSGKQNIAEGSMASGTSKKIELKLVGIARASLEELLEDYKEYGRQHNLSLWDKNDHRAIIVRNTAYKSNKSYMTYKIYIEEELPEVATNTMICIINQTNYLLDQLLRQLEKQLLEEGGITERIYQARQEIKRKQ